MFRSLKIAAASALVVGGLAAAPAFAAPMGSSYSPSQLAEMQAKGAQAGFVTTDEVNEPILPRAFRSKCDDLTDTFQQQQCFRGEQDDMHKDSDGEPLND